MDREQAPMQFYLFGKPDQFHIEQGWLSGCLQEIVCSHEHEAGIGDAGQDGFVWDENGYVFHMVIVCSLKIREYKSQTTLN
jgi:hypothetical protein